MKREFKHERNLREKNEGVCVLSMRVYGIECVASNFIDLLNPWRLSGNYPTKILNSLKTCHIKLKCLISMYFVNST